jgi:hypothetical protein
MATASFSGAPTRSMISLSICAGLSTCEEAVVLPNEMLPVCL